MFPQLVNRFRGAATAAAVGLLAALVGCASAPTTSGEGAELSGVPAVGGLPCAEAHLRCFAFWNTHGR